MSSTLLGRSLLQTSTIKPSEVDLIFSRAQLFKEKSYKNIFDQPPVVALLFFEPSTRTKMSFSLATQRIGGKTLDWSSYDSSVLKGENYLETVKTIEAMGPEVMIVRHSGKDEELAQGLKELSVPVINAGSGVSEHPTQALLDVFTLRPFFNNELSGKKLLFVGDVKHSRVAASNFSLMKLLGLDLAVCCPDFMKPDDGSDFTHFSELKEALAWADVVMGLRAQLERHKGIDFSEAEYKENYQLNPEKLKTLSSQGLIMHPGPHRPLDMDQAVLNDPRCLIREQVKNGVYIRASLLSLILQKNKVEQTYG